MSHKLNLAMGSNNLLLKPLTRGKNTGNFVTQKNILPAVNNRTVWTNFQCSNLYSKKYKPRFIFDKLYLRRLDNHLAKIKWLPQENDFLVGTYMRQKRIYSDSTNSNSNISSIPVIDSIWDKKSTNQNKLYESISNSSLFTQKNYTFSNKNVKLPLNSILKDNSNKKSAYKDLTLEQQVELLYYSQPTFSVKNYAASFNNISLYNYIQNNFKPFKLVNTFNLDKILGDKIHLEKSLNSIGIKLLKAKDGEIFICDPKNNIECNLFYRTHKGKKELHLHFYGIFSHALTNVNVFNNIKKLFSSLRQQPQAVDMPYQRAAQLTKIIGEIAKKSDIFFTPSGHSFGGGLVEHAIGMHDNLIDLAVINQPFHALGANNVALSNNVVAQRKIIYPRVYQDLITPTLP